MTSYIWDDTNLSSNSVNAMKKISILVDRDVFERILGFAMRIKDGQFNPLEIINFAYSVQSRVIINGMSIVTKDEKKNCLLLK